MSNPIGDVIKFMRAAGQDVLNGSETQAALYMTLIQEEIQEFFDAVKEGNDTEILDAIFDTIWVMQAYGISRGWNMYSAWDEGAKSNLSKIDAATGLCIRRDDGKILKPEGWQPPNFRQFVE
jgi:predicted HAD superfamily Cof-like phosphohydrolase